MGKLIPLFSAAVLLLIAGQILTLPPLEKPPRPRYPTVDETPELREYRLAWEARRDALREQYPDDPASMMDEVQNDPIHKKYESEKQKLEKSDKNYHKSMLNYLNQKLAFDTAEALGGQPPALVAYVSAGTAALGLLTTVFSARKASLVTLAGVGAVFSMTLPTSLCVNLFDFTDLGLLNGGSAVVAFLGSLYVGVFA
mmetsp:Transcript_19726/g.64133  ORF Transcript_19726/g.64133 Transcript_19726/m.64133 type:complete len:198 (-) Transcript_19726:142-735(-)